MIRRVPTRQSVFGFLSVLAAAALGAGFFNGFNQYVVGALMVLFMALFIAATLLSYRSVANGYEDDQSDRLDRERLYERESAAAYAASIRVDAGDSGGGSDFGSGDFGSGDSGSSSSSSDSNP
jgi:hypothetical protein